VPVWACTVPLHDVLGFRPEIPDSIDRRIDGGFDGNGVHVLNEFDE
jgi:hypothetical protein